MNIGVPKEIKPLEGRVALVPNACADFVNQGHTVYVQSGAGIQSGFSDEDYVRNGAEMLPDAESLYANAELVVKVKEPYEAEIDMLRPDHLLFCFLHLAANVELMKRLLDIGLTAVAFETVEEDGGLPVLAPMSDIAGRIAVQVGAHLLHAPQGGHGLLLGGCPGADRGRVVILGAGKAGGNSARMAADLGAEVVVFDKNRNRLEAMRSLGKNVNALFPFAGRVDEEVKRADLLVGAILVTGARTPHLVSADQVASMKNGSVIVDISVDQGGCIETTRPTTYADPTFLVDGVIHFGVTNMPGAVPRTASQALCGAMAPYLMRLTASDWRQDAAMKAGINVENGKIMHSELKVLET